MLLYLVTNSISQKAYIGITRGSAEARWAQHNRLARRGGPWPLHRAIRRHGLDAFSLRVLAVGADWNYLCQLEREAIRTFETFGAHGYNATHGGDGMAGFQHSAETKARMSAVRRGREGHIPGEATRQKLSLIRTGRKQSAEHVANATKARTGKPRSAKARANIAASQIGRVHSAETKARLSAQMLGRRHTDEAKAKIAAAGLGRRHSEGSRLKIAAAAAAREQTRRARKEASASR